MALRRSGSEAHSTNGAAIGRAFGGATISDETRLRVAASVGVVNRIICRVVWRQIRIVQSALTFQSGKFRLDGMIFTETRQILLHQARE